MRAWCRAAAGHSLLLLVGCASQQPVGSSTASGEVLFPGTPQELAPHQDGDHFVYRASDVGGDERLQVEHLSALQSAGEFVATLSEDGVAIGKTHLRDDGATVSLVSEGLLQQDAMIVYAQPLPSLTAPLRSSTQHATSPVTVIRVSDGAVLATGRAEQTVTAHRASSEAGEAALEIRTERSIVLPDRTLHLTVTTWMTPGIGEVRSEGTTNGGPVLRRELVCAIIAGKRVGDCASLLREAQEQ